MGKCNRGGGRAFQRECFALAANGYLNVTRIVRVAAHAAGEAECV